MRSSFQNECGMLSLSSSLTMGFEDRLTFTVAFNRVMHGMLAAVGHLLEHAAALATNPPRPPQTPPGRPSREEDGQPDDTDSSIYMQTTLVALPTPGTSMRRLPWSELIAMFQDGLDLMPKDQRANRVERMLTWLDHRCTREGEGFFLGHVQGAPAELLAVLVAYRDTALAACVWPDSDWFDTWTEHFGRYLPVAASSLAARGKSPRAVPPIMLFSRALPSSSEGIPSPVDLDPTPEEIDLLARDEREARQDRECDETRWEQECRERDHEAARLNKYLEIVAGTAATPSTPEPMPKRRRVLVFEMSSGSCDAPRMSRCLRVPVDEHGTTTVQLRCGGTMTWMRT